MAIQPPNVKPTSFTRVVLSAGEQKAGMQFNGLNLAVLQNLRADTAEEKLNLEFTPNDVHSFTQSEAYLKGQLDMLNYLIETSATASQLTSEEI